LDCDKERIETKYYNFRVEEIIVIESMQLITELLHERMTDNTDYKVTVNAVRMYHENKTDQMSQVWIECLQSI
jgi:hypothetical protein